MRKKLDGKWRAVLGEGIVVTMMSGEAIRLPL
jgi:hypothetical protein